MRPGLRLIDVIGLVLVALLATGPTAFGSSESCSIDCGWGGATDVGSYAHVACDPAKCFWTECELTNQSCFFGGTPFLMQNCGNPAPCQDLN
jgi:hypothetical protein